MKRDRWTFLTNHGHVLVCLAMDPEALLRDVAADTGITERAVQQIVADLEKAGTIIRIKAGRRNRYIVRCDQTFRHHLESGVRVGEFVDLVRRGRRAPAPSSGWAAAEEMARVHGLATVRRRLTPARAGTSRSEER